MWEFPSIQNFIGSNGFIILWTLLVFAGSMYAWICVYLSIKHSAKESTGQFLKNVAIGSVTFLVMIFSSYGLTSRYNEVSRCRNFDLTKVKAIRVKRMPGEDTFGGTTILINDSNKIREGLKILKTASSRDREKDRFIYGYQIRLVLEEGETGDFYLNYFAENQNGQKTDVVIPYCDAEPNTHNSESGGIYASTAFGDWLRENIEPEFKKIQ